MKKNNYIIGDIHGCFEELIELEEKIKLHSEKENASPFIISCGDLIDRGLYSKDVIEHFISGYKNKTHLAILGNHELMMLQALESFSLNYEEIQFSKLHKTYYQMYEISKCYYPETSLELYIKTMNNVWLEAGGIETIKSFGIEEIYLLKDNITKEITDFLINLPIFYEGDNFFVTHAIPDSSKDLDIIKIFNDNVSNQDLIEIRKSVNNVIWNKKIPNDKINNKLNISGHSPFKEVKNITASKCFTD